MNNNNTLQLKPSEKLNKDHLKLVSVIFLFKGDKKVLLQHRDNNNVIFYFLTIMKTKQNISFLYFGLYMIIFKIFTVMKGNRLTF